MPFFSFRTGGIFTLLFPWFLKNYIYFSKFYATEGQLLSDAMISPDGNVLLRNNSLDVVGGVMAYCFFSGYFEGEERREGWRRMSFPWQNGPSLFEEKK